MKMVHLNLYPEHAYLRDYASIPRRTTEEHLTPYWAISSDSGIELKDGFIYLLDEEYTPAHETEVGTYTTMDRSFNVERPFLYYDSIYEALEKGEPFEYFNGRIDLEITEALFDVMRYYAKQDCITSIKFKTDKYMILLVFSSKGQCMPKAWIRRTNTKKKPIKIQEEIDMIKHVANSCNPTATRVRLRDFFWQNHNVSYLNEIKKNFRVASIPAGLGYTARDLGVFVEERKKQIADPACGQTFKGKPCRALR